MPNRKPTSVDVAKKAGVSQSIVSLVLNGKATGRASAAVQRAVWRAARQLGYRPNPSAQALRRGRANVIALVVPEILNPFFGPVLRGAQTEAERHGYSVILVDIAQRDERQNMIVDRLERHDVDGFVVWRIPADGLGPNPAQLVLVENRHPGYASVDLDVASGTRQAVEHLIALSHRRIGHIALALDGFPTFAARKRTYRQTLKRAGRHVAAGDEVAPAQEAVERLLASVSRPTALFCDDDSAAGCVAARPRSTIDGPPPSTSCWRWRATSSCAC